MTAAPGQHRAARRIAPAMEKLLVSRALAAREHAHAPYSGYHVGAALLCEDGTVVDGCNVENASYPLCLCAERTALCAAVAQGKRGFSAMCVATSSSPPASPCGACRQVMMELGPAMQVILCNAAGERARMTVADLLPRAFDGSQLASPASATPRGTAAAATPASAGKRTSTPRKAGARRRGT